MRSELEGSQIFGTGGKEEGVGGGGGDGMSSPIAELPGSSVPVLGQAGNGRRRVVVGNGVVYL